MLKFTHGNRTVVKEALYIGTAVILYYTFLLRCFYTLTDNIKLNFVKNSDKSLNNVVSALGFKTILNEALIKLYYVNRQYSDKVKGGIACAKVINTNLKA